MGFEGLVFYGSFAFSFGFTALSIAAGRSACETWRIDAARARTALSSSDNNRMSTRGRWILLFFLAGRPWQGEAELTLVLCRFWGGSCDGC
jgi:hypothetical protein